MSEKMLPSQPSYSYLKTLPRWMLAEWANKLAAHLNIPCPSRTKEELASFIVFHSPRVK